MYNGPVIYDASDVIGMIVNFGSDREKISLAIPNPHMPGTLCQS